MLYSRGASNIDLLEVRKELSKGKTIFDLPFRVVYYARVSGDTSEQINSLKNQVKFFESYIESQSNWAHLGGYIDEGVSGANIVKRNSFKKMISEAKKGAFDLIITKEISRFSRCTLDSIHYTKKLLECGVGVYFQSDNIITIYGDAQLRLTIMSSIAQDEVRRLSERVKFGIVRAYESGKVLGNSSIYGYDKINGDLVINHQQSRFIYDLFEIYSQGNYGYRKTAKILADMGYCNQKGKPLNPGSLKHILSNPKYKGYYRGRITESDDYLQKKRRDLAPEQQLLYKDDKIPAIVTEEIWDKCNKVMKERSSKHGRKGTKKADDDPLQMIEQIAKHMLAGKEDYEPFLKELMQIYKKVGGEGIAAQ